MTASEHRCTSFAAFLEVGPTIRICEEPQVAAAMAIVLARQLHSELLSFRIEDLVRLVEMVQVEHAFVED
jgi:hypothetical protein